jgi:Kef-type K+ transport system membrane component KefB
MSLATQMPAVAVHKSEALLFFTLLELTVIVATGRVGGALARRFGQAAVVGEIIGGILLGPSLFGWAAPQTFDLLFRSAAPEPLQILASLGLVLLMFQIGLEFDFSHLTERANRRTVVRVAAACLVVPFVIGLLFGYQSAPWLSPHANRIHSALFVATAFSITAVPVLGRILVELNMARTRLGVIAMSAAAINDVVGWLLLALITALAIARFDAGAYALRVTLLLVFIAASILVARPLLKRMVRFANPRSGRLSANLLGGLLIVIFLAAMATYQLGIFAIFGGFMMGVIVSDEHELVHAWRERVGAFVTVFFLPIFFTYTGLRTEIGGLDGAAAWGWCALAVLLATLAKLGAGYLTARASGLNHAESTIIGFLMNTRGLMELIVINVGFDLGVISQQVFTMLVIMAIVSTVIATPVLRRYLPRAGLSLAPASASS